MLNPLYQAVSQIILWIHSALAPIFGATSGASWALAIVLLTIAMRLVLFPLFVRQIKFQRQMQVLQPKIKELQQKYKGDRERLNTEMMALYKEHGANPLTGCLPLVLQIPIFIALFHVLNSIKPHICTQTLNHLYGCTLHRYTFAGVHVPPMTPLEIRNMARAKIFGVPIAASFSSNTALLHYLNASATATKVLAIILVLLMGASTFITQRQLLANPGNQNTPMAQQQKIMLYVLPLIFLAFGFRFPLGVLLYWVTTNVWSMGQQAVVIRRMPATAGGPAAGGTAKPAPRATPAPGAAPALAPDPGTPPATPPPNARPNRPNRPRNRRRRRR